jgi:hypothetical protein
MLMDEVHRYLAAVEAFRAQGSEPHWRAELAPAPRASGNRARSRARKPRGSSKPRKGG